MNRQIATSIVSIGAMVVMLGAGTYAFFSDSGTSSSNTFSTGAMDLKLTDASESVQDSVTASFGGSLVPGSCTGNQTLSLRNSGTIAANHAEVTVSNVVTDTNSDAAPDMDSFLRIQVLTYDGADVTGQITNSNGNLFKDLNDWAADPSVLDNLGLTDLSTDHPLVMNICLDSSAGNVIQGDSVVSTFSATLNQDVSQ